MFFVVAIIYTLLGECFHLGIQSKCCKKYFPRRYRTLGTEQNSHQSTVQIRTSLVVRELLFTQCIRKADSLLFCQEWQNQILSRVHFSFCVNPFFSSQILPLLEIHTNSFLWLVSLFHSLFPLLFLKCTQVPDIFVNQMISLPSCIKPLIYPLKAKLKFKNRAWALNFMTSVFFTKLVSSIVDATNLELVSSQGYLPFLCEDFLWPLHSQVIPSSGMP